MKGIKHIKRKNLEISQIFTPNYVAEFMVRNCLNILNLISKNNPIINIKALEPSAGEGIFLDHLIRNNITNITAYELDKSLSEKLTARFPNVNFQFKNVFETNLKDKYNLIIGNPPYLGQNYNSSIFQRYTKDYPICKKYFVGNMDLFYYFIHLGIEKLKPGGILSFITTKYWITKSQKTGIKLLKPHILDECFLLQYIDLSPLCIFKDAPGQNNCIFVLQKKTTEEKINNVNNSIQIIQFIKNNNIEEKVPNNNQFYKLLLNGNNSFRILRYQSMLKNNNLPRLGSWNLQFPLEVKNIITRVEKKCKKDNKKLVVKDFFIIRNGLILIKDEIFILKLNENLKILNNSFYIKIKNKFYELNKNEKLRLKKVYKSKSIKPYGYENDSFIGYLIFFNKDEIYKNKRINLDDFLEKKYPNLVRYLHQYKEQLRDILAKAHENINDIYFPRRGGLIIKRDSQGKRELVDLEPYYENGQKLLFKYISNENIFGYTENPYYATSDTYFLWPNSNNIKIDYLFLIPYLNSKLVRFLFKAKNISIKRSKTKLENELLIPNLDLFCSKRELSIITLIKLFSSWLINFQAKENLETLKEKIQTSKVFSLYKDNTISLALNERNHVYIKKFVDKLIFNLFKLKEENIDYLIKKYYNF